jgi:transcriptional regulator with GAF, ATPase, and Fis domain
MWNSLPRVAKVILGILWPIIATLLTLALSGVVGNRADSALLQLLPFFQQIVSVSVARWLIVMVVLLPSLAIGIPLGLTAFLYYRSQQAAINLVKLDDSLLRLLSSFKQNQDREAAAILLFQEFLEDTLELFTDGCRISILRPDGDNSEHLTIWQSLRVPSETIQRTQFYVGSDSDNKRVGIAGLAFKQQTLKIVHLSWQKDKWSQDDKNYYDFVNRTTQKSMPYRAVVAVPIVDNTNPNKCLGVLCLDSMNEQAFDSKRVQDGLRSVADRISAILLILKNYS